MNNYEQASRYSGLVSYQVFEGTFLRASYGEGFRFPTIGERYILTNVGSLHLSQPRPAA